MPYPIPPAPRIAYDDPGVASLFFDRSALARYTGNPNIWVDALQANVKYMNAGDGFGVVPTHDNDSTGAYDGIWYASTLGATFEIVFQELYTIRGIELVIVEAGNDAALGAALVGPINMYSIDEDQDPFGIITRSHGVIPTPAYTHASTYPVYPSPSAPGMLVPGFAMDTGPFGPTYHSVRIDSPLNVTALDIRRTKALRWTFTPGRDSYSGGSGPTEQLIKLHLYGYPSERNYLNFISAYSSTILPAEELTFGDSPLGSSEDLVFRIKNFSDTLTANDIVLKAENGPGYLTPQPYTQILFSNDGINFSSTFTLPSNLPPGATSFVIYIRKVTPGNAQQGQKYPRIRADVGSWT